MVDEIFDRHAAARLLFSFINYFYDDLLLWFDIKYTALFICQVSVCNLHELSQNGNRSAGSGVRDDSQWFSRLGPPGGNGLSHCNGGRHDAGRYRHQRQTISLREDPLKGCIALCRELHYKTMKSEVFYLLHCVRKVRTTWQRWRRLLIMPGWIAPAWPSSSDRFLPSELSVQRCRPFQFLSPQALGKHFQQSPDDLDINVVYDVSHNIAKVVIWNINSAISLLSSTPFHQGGAASGWWSPENPAGASQRKH